MLFIRELIQETFYSLSNCLIRSYSILTSFRVSTALKWCTHRPWPEKDTVLNAGNSSKWANQNIRCVHVGPTWLWSSRQELKLEGLSLEYQICIHRAILLTDMWCNTKYDAGCCKRPDSCIDKKKDLRDSYKKNYI